MGDTPGQLGGRFVIAGYDKTRFGIAPHLVTLDVQHTGIPTGFDLFVLPPDLSTGLTTGKFLIPTGI